MSNDDRLRPASFRNVPFFVKRQNTNGGRKTSVIEIPGSDTPQIQDHGKEANYFGIEGYITGEDYFPQRNSLINALGAGGIGKLIHPYLGEKNVAVLTWTYTEEDLEGNICKFSMNFVEKDTKPLEILEKDAIVEVFSARDKAMNSVNDIFLESYSVAKKPFSVIKSTKQTLDVGVAVVQNARTVFETNAELQFQINNLKNNTDSAIYDGVSLHAEMFNMLTFGTFLTGEFSANQLSALPLFDDFLDLFDFKTPAPIVSETDPANFIANFIAQSAIIVATSMSPLIEYKSFEEAREVRDLLFYHIDKILTSPDIPSDYYINLRALRSLMAQDIEERAVNLSRTTIITRPQEFSAIVLSYQLYGTIDREDEIIERNGIQNPCMIPANIPIEVLQYE